MKKLLIPFIVCIQALFVTGCAGLLPDAHKIDVQQGNVLTQHALNQLRPGMNKRQVPFILGSPMVIDTFHDDRWDYIYTLEKGGDTLEKKHLTLYFENDAVTRVTGDLRPEPSLNDKGFQKETVVSVDPQPPKRGWLMRALGYIGLADDD